MATRIDILKRAIRNLRSDLDSALSDEEKELLKELIIKGQISTEADLRGYLNRIIQAKERQKEKESKREELRRERA